MAPLCSWLEMYSARTSKFKRRWFVLERGCLHYYDSPDDVMAHVISGVPPLHRTHARAPLSRALAPAPSPR